MNNFIKRAVTIVICIGMLFLWQPTIVTANPGISVNIRPPADVQTGEDFAISVTIINTSNTNVMIGSVWAMIESAGIRVDSQSISRNLAAGSSMQVVLLGYAHAPGIHRVRIDVDYASKTLVNDVLIEVSDAVVQAGRPRLSIPNVSFVPEKPDLTAPFTLNINLRNIGNARAHDLVATFDGGDNFAVTTLTNRIHMASLEQGATSAVSFEIRALDTRRSNEITLALSYDAHTQTETLNLPLPAVLPLPVVQEQQPPSLKAGSFTLRQAQTGQLALKLDIQNTGETEARNIRVVLDGGDRAFPAGGGNTRHVPSIAAGGSATVEYLLATRGELSNHPLNFAFTFSDPDGKAGTSNDRIFVSSNLEPSIKITEFSARPRGDEGEFLFNLRLQNRGLSLAKDISVRFAGTQAFPMAASNLVLIPDLAAGASNQLSLVMKTGAESPIYSIPIEITYRSAAGAEHSTNETIVLSSDAVGIDDTPEQAGTPRVMLERHTLSTDQVLAGDTFTLTLYIRNNADRAVGNMKISLAGVQASAAQGGAGGTVFSTLDGSSSSFFVERIAASAQLIKEVTLFVDPNTTAMIYALPILIEYEDDDGKAFNVNETVNIPVLQESRMRVLSVDIPAFAMVGQAVPVSMEFANTGKVALNSVLIAIEGEFPKENPTFFIPRLEIGLSDFFQGMIIPDAEGTLSGNLAVTFLDGLNQEVRIDHPFTIEVQAMELPIDQMPGAGYPGEAPPQIGGQLFGFPLIYIIAGVAIAIGIVIAAVIIFKKIKAKREAAFFIEKP